jgi:bacillithiol biosynthesis cysteine-adding enzyme BshC
VTERARVEVLPPALAPGAAHPVVEAVRTGQGPAATRFPALPHQESGWREAVERVARAHGGLAFGRDLVARQEELGAGARARANAEALAEGGVAAVVTGQQPGLLGGPLMTFHKAAGALHLARRLAAAAARPVVPVFWVQSEDHDLLEADRAVVIDEQGQARRLALGLAGEGRSLMHVDVPPAEARRLLDALRALLPDTPRASEALGLVGHREGAGFARWSAEALLRLLGDSGLVVLEPEVWQAHAGPALADLATEGAAIGDALRRSGEALRAEGLPAPLEVPPGQLPLFVRDAPGGARRRVRSDGAGPFGGAGSAEALAARLHSRPELGSGDAAGRVFVQNRLLPVLAYVAGPTELAYHAQVRAGHEAVGRPYPFAVPRPEATWIDAKSERTAAAFGFTAAAVLRAAETPPSPAEDGAVEAALLAWQSASESAGRALDPLVSGPGDGPVTARRARDRLAEEARQASDAIRAAFRRDAGVGAARWVRLMAFLRPRGRPQERDLSPVSLVARYGVEAWRSGLESLDPLVSGHFLVHLG